MIIWDEKGRECKLGHDTQALPIIYAADELIFQMLQGSKSDVGTPFFWVKKPVFSAVILLGRRCVPGHGRGWASHFAGQYAQSPTAGHRTLVNCYCNLIKQSRGWGR